MAGVAGGIADWLNAPVGLVRVFLFFVGVVSVPVIAAYALAALLIPARGHDRPTWDNLIGVGRLAALVVISELLFPSAGIEPSAATDASPGLWIPVLGLPLLGTLLLFASDYARGRARTDAEARAVVLATAPLVAITLLLAAAVALAPGPRWDVYVGAAVVVIGLGVLLAARAGRVRPLVTPAVIALSMATWIVVAGVRLEGGVGDVQATKADLRSGALVVRRAYGDVTVDLRGLGSDRPASLVASVGMGEVRVAVPKGTRVRLDAHVGAGEIDARLAGRSYERVEGLDRSFTLGNGRAAPQVRLRLSVGVGEVHVGSGRDYLASAVER